MAGIIVDIDGTLLRNGEGIDNTIAWVNKKSKNYRIYLVTGRPERSRAATTRSLRLNNVIYHSLYMNNLGLSNDLVIKYKIQQALQLLKIDNIIMAVDNDQSARDAYSSVGIQAVDPLNLPKFISKNIGFWQDIFPSGII